MNRFKAVSLSTAALLAAITLAQHVNATPNYTDRLFMEVNPGDSLTARISETYDGTDGSGTEGPFIGVLEFVAPAPGTTILGRQPNLVEDINGPEPLFYQLDSQGLFTLTDGDPASGGDYENFIDPRPTLISDPINPDPNVGTTFSGQWEGYWSGPDEHWTGTWSETVFIDGYETFTSPLGTFDATRFRREGTNTVNFNNTPFTSTSVFTEYTWISSDNLYLGNTGTERTESDFDGDGNLDWEEETQFEFLVLSFTNQAIDMPDPVIEAPYSPPGGTPSNDVIDALAAVQNSTQTGPLGNPGGGNTGSFSFVSETVQMDDDDVQELVDALVADGATTEQAFVRVELPYDEGALAAVGITEGELAPFWWDESSQKWVVVGTTTSGAQGEGEMATLPGHEDLVGYYGINTAEDYIWLNVNHASLYGVVVVPEPASLGLLGVMGTILLRRRRGC